MSQRDTRTKSGWPPGTIGDLSARVGCDVRELMMEGYSLVEIYDVADGKCSLEELRQRGPRRAKTGCRCNLLNLCRQLLHPGRDKRS
jgi:hypothetical protein